METIFDHNITDKEFNEICVKNGIKDKASYLDSFKSQEKAYLHIAFLYQYRKDEKNFEKYFDLTGFPAEILYQDFIS